MLRLKWKIKLKNYPRVGVTVISTRKLDTISWTVNVTKKEKLWSDTRLRQLVEILPSFFANRIGVFGHLPDHVTIKREGNSKICPDRFKIMFFTIIIDEPLPDIS